MLCYGCNLTSICKVFEMATNMSPSINITVSDCRMRPNGVSVAVAPPVTPPVSKPAIRSQDSLQNISDRIKEASRPDPIPEAPIITKKKAKKVACAECKEKILESDVIRCASCGKILCENCATHDMATKKSYCEHCWDTAPTAQLPD